MPLTQFLRLKFFVFSSRPKKQSGEEKKLYQEQKRKKNSLGSGRRRERFLRQLQERDRSI